MLHVLLRFMLLFSVFINLFLRTSLLPSNFQVDKFLSFWDLIYQYNLERRKKFKNSAQCISCKATKKILKNNTTNKTNNTNHNQWLLLFWKLILVVFPEFSTLGQIKSVHLFIYHFGGFIYCFILSPQKNWSLAPPNVLIP